MNSSFYHDLFKDFFSLNREHTGVYHRHDKHQTRNRQRIHRRI